MSQAAGIYALESAYLDRYVQFGLAGDRVISLSFPPTPDEGAADEHPLLERIAAYLEGEREEFNDVEIGLTVDTDHRRVLEAVRDIPYGEQIAVERLCRSVGFDPNDEGQDTVREAIAENPVPLIVPDHRVRDGPSGAPPAVEQALRSLESL